jgi:hypothetical protein
VPAAPVAWAPDGSAVLYSRPGLVTLVTDPPRYQNELFRLRLADGTRTRLTFTATLNRAGQPVDEGLGGFVAMARVRFRSKLGTPAPAEIITAALGHSRGLRPPRPDLHGPPPPLEAVPPGPFFTADPTV